MKLSAKCPGLLRGLLVGAAIGAGGMYAGLEWQKNARLREIKAAESSYENYPEGWLFPPGTTFEDLFPDPVIRAALLEPDSIRIHEALEDGPLVAHRWNFSDKGVAPDEETAERLKHALGSMSSYRGATACVFHADVLLRLEKDGEVHDLVFCFGCGDIEMGQGGPSMSHDGRATFFKCFCDTLPGFTRLHEMRLNFEARK